MSAAELDPTPRPEELPPDGPVFLEMFGEAEVIAAANPADPWHRRTDEERAKLATLAAVTARRSLAQIRSLGYETMAHYIQATTDPIERPRRLRPVDESSYEDFLEEPDRTSASAGGGRSAAGIDAADLLAMDLPPLRWIVPDVICEGTTVIAAPPKIGKSCLVYQAAVETSVGGELFGRRVTPGSALYLALEDGARRGRDRLVAALAGRTMPRGRLEVRWSAPMIGQGLEDEIARWLDAHADATIVAIDTLGKVRSRGDGRQNAYQVDVDDLGRLQGLFRDRNVALLIVHHARKETGDDFLASVSGTYGLTGSADTIVVLKRKRLEAFGSISVTGRDVADAELSVRFDGLIWHEAPSVLAEGRFERAEVYQVIVERGPIFPAAIGQVIGKERTAVQHLVDAMVRTGAVARTGKGYIATDPPNVLSLPPHSTHSYSEISEGGQYARARAYGEAEEDDAGFFEPEPAS